MDTPTPRSSASSERRGRYHHGHLRSALVEGGLELARTGGIEAVTIREVTRRADVTANAAYRHFENREALLEAVAAAALARLAQAIEARAAAPEQATVEPPLRRLYAVGRGYVAFALDEPGWFEIAFFSRPNMQLAADDSARAGTGRTPFELLSDALDAMVDDGVLPAARRPNAEFVCWSAVHGLAVLATKGPLASAPREVLDALAHHVVLETVSGVARR